METIKTKIALLLFAVTIINYPVHSLKITDPIRINKAGRMIWNETGQEDNFPLRPNTSGVMVVYQNYIGDVINGIGGSAGNYEQIVIHGVATERPVSLEVILVNKAGEAFTAKASLTRDRDFQTINLSDFSRGEMFLLPRPYPGFLPLWYKAKLSRPFNLSEVEKMQLIVPNENNEELSGFELTSVTIK